MKILLVTYYFPPDPAVGGVRAGAIHEALRRAGHEVQVISRRMPDIPPESGVHRVRTLPNARELLLALRGLVRRRASANGSSAAGGYRPPDEVASWKRFLMAMALMPDDYRGFIGPAVLRALRLMVRGDVDLVYTSGPPHSMHLVGLLLRALTGIRWAAEFRDPWTDNAIQPRYSRSPAAEVVRGWLERRCLRAADHVISLTAAAAPLLARKTGRDNVVVVRNGIMCDPPMPTRTTPADTKTGECRILYMGNLYHRRDPRPLFRALAALRARAALPGDGVRLDLYGECRWYNDISVAAAAEEAGIGDLVTIHDPVPLEEARRLTREADLLLLLAQDQPLQVPQKLYEYLAAGRPILAFTDRDGETAAILERVGGQYVVYDEDPASAEVAVLDALLGRSSAEPDPLVLRELSSERQLERLIRLLETGAGDGAEAAAVEAAPARGDW